MTQLALQEAAATILAVYLSSHEVGGAQLPALIVAVGHALAPALEAVPFSGPLVSPRRRRARFPIASDLEPRRIDHVDQIEMLWQAEITGTPSEEVADRLINQAPKPERPAATTMPEANLDKTCGTHQGDDAAAQGVTITHLPEVRRGSRRLS